MSHPASNPSNLTVPAAAPSAPPRLAIVPRRPVPLTVVIPTLNEAHQVGDAVAALDWVDEVIVVDGGSSDDTASLAADAGARVIELRGSTIGGQRNAGIDAARNEWVLALDADERATPALADEIRAILAAPRFEAYSIRFRNFHMGRELKHGHWGRDWHVRLFRRECHYTTTQVHERLEAPEAVGTLDQQILHTPYRDLAHHLRKIVFYSELGARDLRARGKRAGVKELALRPFWRFLREYVGYRGFLDGRLGLMMAALSAVAAFLKYANLYALERSETAR